MTVRELIAQLQTCPPDVNVYVPDSRSQTAEIAQSVETLVHIDTASLGVNIPDDVVIIPWHD